MKEKILRFKDGIPGFEEYKEYVLILNEDRDNPFHRLQSVRDENISFLVVSPFVIEENYEFELSDSTVNSLEIEKEEDITLFSIVKIPDNIEDMTVNLAAPIVINVSERLGKQVVLHDTDYSVRHRVAGDE